MLELRIYVSETRGHTCPYMHAICVQVATVHLQDGHTNPASRERRENRVGGDAQKVPAEVQIPVLGHERAGERHRPGRGSGKTPRGVSDRRRPLRSLAHTTPLTGLCR